jgi:hypothetical protein
MTAINFNRYLAKFERMVCYGVELDLLGRTMPVSVREGKLYYSKFARFMGGSVENQTPLAIDYYGYFKKSFGLIRYLEEIQGEIVDKQIKDISTTVVIFNSIRVEDIEVISKDEYLLWGFTEFKNTILDKRGLGNKRRTIENRPLQVVNTS